LRSSKKPKQKEKKEKIVNETNGWVEFENKRETYLKKYVNQIVVVLSKGKHQRFYLTDAVMKVLGNPGKIKVLTRGNNVAFLGTKAGGYVVRKDDLATLPSIVATTFAREYGLAPGAYNALVDGNMVIFDMKQSPSRL